MAGVEANGGGEAGPLWTMVIVLRGAQGRLVLRFRSAERALEARGKLRSGTVAAAALGSGEAIADDCGAELQIDVVEVCAVLISEMGAELAANGEVALAQTLAQVRLNDLADNDQRIAGHRRKQQFRQGINLMPGSAMPVRQ